MRIRLLPLALLIVLLAAVLAPSRALAHGGHGPATLQTFTQTVGPYDLAVTVELPPSRFILLRTGSRWATCSRGWAWPAT